MDARGGELSGEVVLRVQERGVLEVDGNRVAAQDLRCAPRSAWSLLLHHHLVRTAKHRTQRERERAPTGFSGYAC